MAAAPPSYGAGALPIEATKAYEMVTANPGNTFILDVRTRAEYEFVGHPDVPGGAANIPLIFYSASPGEPWKRNNNFVSDVLKRYEKSLAIIIICRSGPRAKAAARLLTEAGFGSVYYMTDSFEGPKDENGHRTIGGWKTNGLPYTYRLDKGLVYK
jgi:rhodanese-related sulfurtransferase